MISSIDARPCTRDATLFIKNSATADPCAPDVWTRWIWCRLCLRSLGVRLTAPRLVRLQVWRGVSVEVGAWLVVGVGVSLFTALRLAVAGASIAGSGTDGGAAGDAGVCDSGTRETFDLVVLFAPSAPSEVVVGGGGLGKGLN